MPSVSPITKSPVTKYLQDNCFYIVKENHKLTRGSDLYLYSKNGDYLGDMLIRHRGFGLIISKFIFKEKLQPIFQEYIKITKKMGDFVSKNRNPREDKFIPISITTTKATIDKVNKTRTIQVIKRVLEKEPIIAQDIYEKSGIKMYEQTVEPIKYKIESITEETKPYTWGKYSKYSPFI